MNTVVRCSVFFFSPFFFFKSAFLNSAMPFSSAEMQPGGQFRHGVMQAS